jgi:serine/threonine protein kinase
VAHGDIKPQNILIDQNGRAKLADFGLSEVVEPGEQSSRFLGSPFFKPPEVMDRIRFDPFAADIWSLGVTMFWIARARSPFPTGDARQFQEAVHLGLTARPSGMGTAFFKLLRSMIEPDPAKRITIDGIADHALFMGLQVRPTRSSTHVMPHPAHPSTCSRRDDPRRQSAAIIARRRPLPAVPTFDAK